MPEVKSLVRLAAAVVLVAAAASLAQAQRRPVSAQPSNRTADPQAELEREMTWRTLEEDLKKPDPRRREQRLAFAKISEDFTRIQVLNNDVLAHVASRNATLDMDFLARSTGEIRKLALRLRENLVLPEPVKGDKRSHAAVGAGPEQLKASLAEMGKLVAAFAHNPIFKEVNVVDAQLSAKARRDLEDIIELSDQIKKVCERLGKLKKVASDE